MNLKNIKQQLFTLLILGSVSVSAQQTPIFSQYILNKYVFNPAVTGTEDHFTATANYRYQWQEDILHNPAALTATWMFGFSTYF